MRALATVRKQLRKVGLDVARHRYSPEYTFAGLASQSLDTIIDVGANEGQFARRATAIWRSADIYCFEPLADPYQRLESWAREHPARIHVFKSGLGEHVGELNMHEHEKHSPSSSFLATTDQCVDVYPQTADEHLVRVAITTLDAVFPSSLRRPHGKVLLKLDVQGYEDRVLRGGASFLPRCHAVLVEVNLSNLYEGQADFLTLSNLLYDAGFQYAGNCTQHSDRDGTIIYIDALFMKTQQPVSSERP